MAVETLLPSENAPAAAPAAVGPGVDLDALVAELGALPRAPLAMPKQRLEHEGGVLRQALRLLQVRPARATQG